MQVLKSQLLWPLWPGAKGAGPGRTGLAPVGKEGRASRSPQAPSGEKTGRALLESNSAVRVKSLNVAYTLAH